MDIKDLFKDRSEEEISALAYNIGRTLDDAINRKLEIERIDNKALQASIFEFRNLLLGRKELLEEYDRIFKMSKL